MTGQPVSEHCVLWTGRTPALLHDEERMFNSSLNCHLEKIYFKILPKLHQASLSSNGVFVSCDPGFRMLDLFNPTNKSTVTSIRVPHRCSFEAQAGEDWQDFHRNDAVHCGAEVCHGFRSVIVISRKLHDDT